MIRANNYINCPLCNSAENKILYPSTLKKRTAKTRKHYTCTSPYLAYHENIVRCRRCSMVFTNPQPSREDLLKIYKKVEDPLYIEQTIAREYTFRKSLQQLHGIIEPPGKLLDIGCYTGVFMEIGQQAGWKVHGNELSSWGVKMARKSNLDIFEGDIETITLAEKSLDVVTLWDVVEHLSDPGKVLAKAYKLLKPGGILALSTYFINSAAVFFLRRYYPFFMDMHLSHFSKKTMCEILGKYNFQLVRIKSHVRTLRMKYFLEKLSVKVPLGKTFLRRIAKMNLLAERLIRIRGLGLVNVFARKI